MKNPFLHIGNDNYVNLDKVILITAANADKVRKYRADRGIDKNSSLYFNCSSDKETRSMILLDGGAVYTSSVRAKVLNSRAKNAQDPKAETE